MKYFVMKPISCSQAEAALMVKFAAFFDPAFSSKVDETAARLRRMAAGTIAPTPSILAHLWLTKDGDGFLWHPV